MSRPLLRAALAVAGSVLLVGPALPVHAVDDDLGTPGFCADDDGVTVVVDFQGLGGETIVRCAPGSQPRSGLDTLKAAGFQIDGVQRWGESFICRIEDRPSAAEELPLAGNEGYREACIDTPPSTGYWGYFHADDGGDWVYSGAGGKNRTVVPGGFEGWSFALNTQGGQPMGPGISPVRPRPTTDPAEPTTDAPEEQPSQAPPSRPRSDEDTGGVSTRIEQQPEQSFTGGEELPDVAEARREESQPWPAVAGVVVAAGLGGVALLASRRRRSHDTS